MMTPGFLFAFAGPLSQNKEKASALRYVTGQRVVVLLGPGHGGQCHLQSALSARELI